MFRFVSKSGLPGRICRVLGLSASSSYSSSSSSSSYSEICRSRPIRGAHNVIYHRLVPAGDNVIPLLQHWVDQGKPLYQHKIIRIIKRLRANKRYKHALQICEFLGDMKMFDSKPGDIAIQLHLISKVHGVEKAEEYLSSIPESARVFQVYGALLQCYAETKYIEKAECVFQKMREMGQLNLLPYNIMMSLYSKTGKFDKMNSLIKEVEQKGIQRDGYSYNIQLQAFVSSSDIEGMENLMMKMEIDPFLSIDWHMYSIVFEGYMKVGDTGRALAALTKFEYLVRYDKVVNAYQILMTQFARLGKKQDVYRMFYLLKKTGKSQANCYICMISSLEKLDDLEGAEKIIEEWLVVVDKRSVDMRIPNTLVTAYCKRGQVEKAESFIKLITGHGVKPNPNTWFRVARGYLRCRSEEKAVETMKKAILEINSPQKIDFSPLVGCLEYLNKIGDVSRAEELIQCAEKHNQSSVDVRSRIVEHINRRKLKLKDETLEEDTANESEDE